MDHEVQDQGHLVAYRDMVRDLVACPEFEQWCRTLHLTPSSKEVDEMEHRQSHRRIDVVQPIKTDLDQAAALAGLVAHGIFRDFSWEGVPEPMLFQHIARAVVQMAVIRLVDQGKLKVS